MQVKNSAFSKHMYILFAVEVQVPNVLGDKSEDANIADDSDDPDNISGDNDDIPLTHLFGLPQIQDISF